MMNDALDYYIYAADVWCAACAEDIRARLKAGGKAPAKPEDECSYDSDEYPKGPFSDEESDTPQHCAGGPTCLDPTEIAGETHGKFLENPLTKDGVAYVLEKIAEDPDNPVVQFWRDWYHRNGYPDIPLAVKDDAED